jgi:hypothetical protein
VDNSRPPKNGAATDILTAGAKPPLESEIHRPAANRENPAAAAKTPRALSVPASPLAGYAEASKTPAAQDAKRAEAKASLEKSHGALFKALSLSPEQLDAFKDLLVEKNMVAQDNGTALMSGQTVFDIGKAATTRVKENEDKLRSLLGDDNYAFYKQFEDTQQEREKVELFKQSLRADQQLDAEQENRLILAMREERRESESSLSTSRESDLMGVLGLDPEHGVEFDEEEIRILTQMKDAAEPDPSQLSRETQLKIQKAIFAKQADGFAQLDARLVERARETLSEPQLKKFAKTLEQQRAMQELGMRFMMAVIEQAPGASNVVSVGK